MADLADQIVTAYHQLKNGSGWVTLTALRAALPGASKADVDRALIGLHLDGRATLISEANQQSLTAADRAAAVRIGGSDKHLMCIEH